MNRFPIVVMPDIDATNIPVEELLERQDLYFSYLLKESPELGKVILFYTSKNSYQGRKIFHSIEIVKIGGRFTHWLLMPFPITFYLLKNGIRPLFLVAGTPFQPYFVALALKFLFRTVNIQVAVHGELSGINSSGFSARLRFLFLKSTLRFASLIRFVSKKQSNDFSHLLTQNQKVVVSPVPIQIPLDSIKVSVGNGLGFVGRIQSERGISEWVEIALNFPQVKKVIVGDGPDRLRMQQALPSAEFKGFLANSELDEVWPQIKVLLSSAPFESYGMALREALLRGIPVVSRENAGSRELFQIAPELVKLYSNTDEAVNAIRGFIEKIPEREKFEDFRNRFSQTQEASLRDLARTWLEL